MTKIYSAKPIKQQTPARDKGYVITAPGADLTKSKIGNIPLESYGVMHKNRNSPTTYLTSLGYEHNLEIYVLDSASKRPLRSVKIETQDSIRGHTDRLGKVVLKLTHGSHQISLNGIGYSEQGAFAPKKVEFQPISFQVDLDSNETVTIYTSGEIVQGERKELSNPGNPHSQRDISLFVKDNIEILALISGGAIIAYWAGKSRSNK